ncbi:MAG: MmgE/PrpD family protein [Acidiferrobacterales bacterium]
MTGITRQLSEFVASISYDALPEDVRERAKWLVTDMIGIAVRARHEAESTAALLGAAKKLGLEEGEASVISEERRYSPPGAAMINGTLAHSLDFDDTHAPGSIHPSAPIVPAALAAAEMARVGGREAVAAIIAGYEVQIRLSLALVPKDHYDRGFHPTATCGTFGAAAAAARVFGLSPDQVVSAFGICLSQAAGTMQYLVDGAWTKRSHVGHAAMSGLIAAALAREGFKGPAEAIEGKAGFLHAYAPNPVSENAIAGLGDTYETMGIAVKPYPACRYSHAALDALIELRAAQSIDDQEIESVEIGLPQTGWNLIGDPESDKQRPENVVDGQFSMPFVAAVALREGSMQWDHYAQHLSDRNTLDLCTRIKTVVDRQAEAEFPANMSAVARMRTARGTFEKFVAIPKGEPENFISLGELRAKFDSLVSPYLSERRRNELANALLSFEQAADISAMLRLAQPDQGIAQQAVAGAD